MLSSAKMLRETSLLITGLAEDQDWMTQYYEIPDEDEIPSCVPSRNLISRYLPLSLYIHGDGGRTAKLVPLAQHFTIVKLRS